MCYGLSCVAAPWSRQLAFVNHVLEYGQSVSDGAQSEQFGVYVLGSHPETFGGIVSGAQLRGVCHAAEEEQVERGYVDAAEAVGVGQAEHIAR